MIDDSVAEVTFRRWRTWGTTVTVAMTSPEHLAEAEGTVRREIAAFDLACNRFRPDSDLSVLNRSGGEWSPMGPLLGEALEIALQAALQTDGACDPTLGGALEQLGYDRDYDQITPGVLTVDPSASLTSFGQWREIILHPSRRAARKPAEVHIDLGATAKAMCVNRSARHVFDLLGIGVLVDIGGDLATAGPAPSGGWRIAVTESARHATVTNDDYVVAIESGAMATSGTTVRTWDRSGRRLHHIIDPATGWPAEPFWRQVTVTAADCVSANAMATAAVVWGEDALFRLPQVGLPSRLVRADGLVFEVGGWPSRDDVDTSTPSDKAIA